MEYGVRFDHLSPPNSYARAAEGSIEQALLYTLPKVKIKGIKMILGKSKD
jgi:hypothetical protein